jgi:hypothetical protein
MAIRSGLSSTANGNAMKVTDELVNAAIEIHNASDLTLRGIKMRERFPGIGFDGTREVYAVADKILDLAWRLASESLTDHSLDGPTATKRIVEAVPGISERTARRAVEEAFRARGKM